MRKVLVIGAAGGVARVAVGRLLAATDDCRFTLADLRPEEIPAGLRGPRTVTSRIDLFDREALGELVRGHDLAINAAGPYLRTAGPAARACLDQRTPCLDFLDDVEALEAVLPFDQEARDRGVALLAGAGISPGLTNVLAADLARRFARVETLDVAWLSGDEGGVAPGRAVLEHVLHIAGDEGVRWRDGAPERFPSYTLPLRFAFGGALGDRELYEVAHPEPLMLARRFPEIPLIRCFGGIDPPGIGAVVRGLAEAVKRRRLSVDDAVRFMQETSEGRLAAPRAWLPAVRGLLGGVRRGMIDAKGLLGFAGYAVGRHQPFAGGILARAAGAIAGGRKTLLLRTAPAAARDTLASMAGATGACVAAFAWLMLRKGFAPGVRYPHEAAPEEVYEAFTRVGVPANQLLDDVLEC